MAINARVHIWYPDGENVGHASMHIGNRDDEDDIMFYVSWWPQGEAGIVGAHLASPSTFSWDKSPSGEGCDPHVTYEIEGLFEEHMKIEWDAIMNKPNAHYMFLPKNCSTIVARVLKAGGATEMMSTANALIYGHNVYWTPKDVAQLCDKIKDEGFLVNKIKSAGCPTKKNSVASVILGLR
jgi:hypothetical protein